VKRLFFYAVMPSLFVVMSLLLSSTVEGAEKETETPDKPLFDFLNKADWSLTGRGTIGEMYFKYQEKYPNTDDVKWQDNMPFLGIGGTLSAAFGEDHFVSIDGYVQQTASGKDSFFGLPEAIDDAILDYNTNLSRRDYAINLSYGWRNLLIIDNSLVASVGYKLGKTDINGTRRNIVSGEGEGIYYRNEKIQFETKGPTLGISYNHPVGESSAVSLNLGYAWLESDYISTQQEITPASTQGLTYGLSWNSTITNKLRYGFSVDAYSYTMGASLTKKEREGVIITNFIDSIEETVYSFKASLYYLWD